MLETIARKINPGHDAIALLKADHREVECLFREFEAIDDGRAKAPLARQICNALSLHAKLEEKFFYPAIKSRVPSAEDLVAEATVEHQTLKSLIRQILRMTPADELFDARIKVLKEYVQHHVKEEEKEIMPKVEGKLDLVKLGAEINAMKQRLSRGRAVTHPGRNPRHQPGAAASAHSQ